MINTDSVGLYLEKLSSALKAKNCAESLTELLKSAQGIMPIFGAEIEFYLSKNLQSTDFKKVLRDEYNFKEEEGDNQFEIEIAPTKLPLRLAQNIEDAKNNLSSLASSMGGEVIFDPCPFKADYGSAAHFHFSFVGEDGAYLDNIALIQNIAQRILLFLPKFFLILAPCREDYARFREKFNAPINYSLGNNNRTTCLRIPDAEPLRIELRAASNNADPYLILCAVMQAIFLGGYLPSEANIIYGNAEDGQYNLKALPKNLEEALKDFDPRLLIF